MVAREQPTANGATFPTEGGDGECYAEFGMTGADAGASDWQTCMLSDGGVFVNGAQVTTADIAATNGIVHVINTVILPPSCGESWLTAAIHMENPYCSCKLTRVRPHRREK